MQLYENVQICLLALMHRYPENIVDINETIFGRQELGAKGWTAADIIELFEATKPTILRTKARIVLDQQETSIYLTGHPEEIPALYIHCHGKIPPYQGNMHMRRKQREKDGLAQSRETLAVSLLVRQ